jgi:hypothetical protein
MHSISSRTAALVLGGTFVLVAILGFIPNPLVSETGIFHVNVHHNIVHLLTGLLILAGPLFMRGREHVLLIVAGVVYGLVGILGFVTGSGMLFGLVAVNEADNYLHLFLAIVLVGAGVLTRARGIIPLH